MTRDQGVFWLQVVPGRHDLLGNDRSPVRTVIVPTGKTCAGVELVLDG